MTAARSSRTHRRAVLLVSLFALTGAGVDRPASASGWLADQSPAVNERTSCTVSSIYDLPRCVEVGERVQVESGGKTPEDFEGRFRGYAGDRLIVESRDGRVASFDATSATRIWVVRKQGRLKGAGTGAVIGGTVGLLFGALPALEGGSSEEIVSAVVGTAAGFALFRALIPGTGAPTLVMSRDLGVATPPPLERTPVNAGAVVLATDIDRLAETLTGGDRLRVRQFDHVFIVGNYAGVQGDELLVSTGDRVQRVREADIASVTRSVGHHPSARKGALIGGLVGGALIGLGMAVQRSEPEAPPESEALTIGDALIGVAMFAGAGAAATRFMGKDNQLVMVGQERPRPLTDSRSRSLAIVVGPQALVGLSVRF